MTYEEINERFNSTPSAIKAKEIDAKLNFINQQFMLLNAEKNKLHKKRYGLSNAVEDEGNKVADQLDIECPEWRMILVKGLNPELYGKQ